MSDVHVTVDTPSLSYPEDTVVSVAFREHDEDEVHFSLKEPGTDDLMDRIGQFVSAISKAPEAKRYLHSCGLIVDHKDVVPFTPDFSDALSMNERRRRKDTFNFVVKHTQEKMELFGRAAGTGTLEETSSVVDNLPLILAHVLSSLPVK